MRYRFILIFALLTFVFSPNMGNAQFFDNLLQKGAESLFQDKTGSVLSEDSIISGLKEALEIGIIGQHDY